MNRMSNTISRQAAIDATWFEPSYTDPLNVLTEVRDRLKALPSAQPEHLTDDDFETIRIHLDACKEKLCNQGRWKEAKEYQRIYDRFMAFASAQPERNIPLDYIIDEDGNAICPKCGANVEWHKYCGECGQALKWEESNE